MFLSKPHTYTLMLSISPTLSLTQSHPSVVRMRENRNHRLSEKQTYPPKYKSDPNTFPSLSPKSPEAALPQGTTHVLQHLETPHWMTQREHFLIAQSSEICPAPSSHTLPAPSSCHTRLWAQFLSPPISLSMWDFVPRISVATVQLSSVTQSCPTLCNPMDCSTPGLPVHHQLPEFTQTHVHGVSDAIQPSHPLLSPSPPAFNLSQHEGLFK